MKETYDKSGFSFDRTAAIATVVGVAALSSACSDRELNLPDRNIPTSQGLFIDEDSSYIQDVQRTEQYTDDPEVIEGIDQLLETPVALWLPDDIDAMQETLTSILEKSSQSETVPLLVAYNIPHRDVGNWSEGGAYTAGEYTAWIAMLSDTIADRSAVVVLEPDALAHIPELDESQATERIELLAIAVDTLHRNQNTAVYLDAGNATWLDAPSAANLLEEVGDRTEHDITGISLNVSNYVSEQETREYAEAIQREYDQGLYIMIDNSRNGTPDAVESDDWCNPVGQRLGEADADFDADAQVEVAYIKTPGQSDGICGVSDRPAGEFDAELLLKQLGE